MNHATKHPAFVCGKQVLSTVPHPISTSLPCVFRTEGHFLVDSLSSVKGRLFIEILEAIPCDTENAEQ